MNVTVTAEAVRKLRALLSEEGDNAVVRVRETKIGSACKSKFVLKLSIDERDDDDLEAEVEYIPFVVSKDLVDQYGNNFSVSLDEHQIPAVAALSCSCCAGARSS